MTEVEWTGNTILLISDNFQKDGLQDFLILVALEIPYYLIILLPYLN